MMLQEAEIVGRRFMRGTAIKALQEDGALAASSIRHPEGNEEENIATRVVLDCSGQSTFLANQKVTGPKYMGSYDKQVAFFTHVRGAIRGSGTIGEQAKDNTLIFYDKKFHWAWFIPIDKEVVSLGMVTPRAKFVERSRRRRSISGARFTASIPRSGDASQARHGRESARDSKLLLSGTRILRQGLYLHWRLAPFHRSDFFLRRDGNDAGGGVCRATSCANISRAKLNGKANPFEEHQMACEQGIDNLEDMIDLFWEQPFAFATFVHSRYVEQMTDAFAGRIYEFRTSAFDIDEVVPQAAQTDP